VDSIALHTTPGIPQHKKPVVALVTAGVEMDVLGLAYDEFTDSQRKQVIAVHPREVNFKEGIIDAFAHGTIKKPETTFGNVKADVLALKDLTYKRLNFCSLILGSSWNDSPADARIAATRRMIITKFRHVRTATPSTRAARLSLKQISVWDLVR